MFPVLPLQIDLGASSVPHIVFDGIHLVLLLVVGYFGLQVGGGSNSKFQWAFGLFVLGELSYLGYHTAQTTFLLSHTVSEVLVFLAFVLVYLGLQETGAAPS